MIIMGGVIPRKDVIVGGSYVNSVFEVGDRYILKRDIVSVAYFYSIPASCSVNRIACPFNGDIVPLHNNRISNMTSENISKVV